MQDTTKLLPTVLLTFLLLLCSIAAPSAQARSPRHHDSAKQARRHDPGKGRRHAARERRRKQARQKATKPVRQKTVAARPHKEHAPHSRETASAETAPSRQDAAVQSEARIAEVLATPCQNTEVIPTAQNLPVVDAATLCLINKERAEHGVAPLILNDDLEAAAQNHCAELIEDDYFAHVAPDGETPVQRIEKTGYIPGPEVGYVIGENLAWGTYQLATPASIVAAWIASPGHLANILESRYTETGIAITPAVPQSLGEGNPGATYAQEFGVIVH